MPTQAAEQSPPSPPAIWHTLTAEATAQLLRADLVQGLSEAEAIHRLHVHGLNRLPDQPGVPAWHELLQPQNLLLPLIALLYAGFGNLPAALFAAGIWLVSTSANLLIRRRIRQIQLAMRARREPSAVLLRQGKRLVIPADELVPGDLLLLAKGQRVPADARLVRSCSLQVDEGLLTGSAAPVPKEAGSPAPADASLAERHNLVYTGSLVTNGTGSALVVATGPQTELWRAFPQPRSPQFPLTLRQKSLADLSRRIAGVALAASGLAIYLAWALSGLPGEESLLAGLALIFATLPFALPPVFTLILARGAHHLARNSVLARDLTTVETLDTITIFAVDKTGTLTTNEPRIARWVPSAWEKQLLELGAAACLADQRVNPLNAALLEAAQQAGIRQETLRDNWPVVAINSFDATRKRMSVVFRRSEMRWVTVLGAPEAVLSQCTRRWTGDGWDEMLPTDRQLVLESAAVLAKAGQRVLALAERRLEASNEPESIAPSRIEVDLVFAGLLALHDPLRTEAPAAVARAQAAGVRVLLLTGDHPVAGEQAAYALGLAGLEQPLTGVSLESMPPEQIQQVLSGHNLVVRLTPHTRLAIVQSFQAAGERVAATGEESSDAPVLEAANLGVALGQGGTDAARQAADAILADNNFQALVDAVFTARLVQANSGKALGFALASKLGLFLAILLPVLFRLPLPMTPLQLLLSGLVVDLLAATLFLGEPAEPGLDHQPPRTPGKSLIDEAMTGRILRGAVSFFVAVTAAYFSSYLVSGSLPIAREVAFATWLISLVLVGYSLRSDSLLILRQNLVSNRWLVFWVAFVTGLLALINTVPWVSSVLSGVPLAKAPVLFPVDWGLALFAALFGVGLAELRKLLRLLPRPARQP